MTAALPTVSAGAGACDGDQGNEVSELTIVTLNLHGGMRTRRIATPRLGQYAPPPDGASSNGAFDVAGVLRSFDADVVVVQEAWWPDEGPAAVDTVAAEQGATVQAAMFGRGRVDPWPHYVAERRGQARGRIGIAVMSRLPVRLVANLPLDGIATDPAPRRCAQHLALDVDGHDLDLVAVHLSSRLPHAPPLQLRRLRPQLPPPGQPTVIVGDFNLWGPPVTAMLPGWRRAIRGRTWPAHRPHSQIDHVLVPDDVDVVDAAVLGEVGSDHRPLRVTLRLR
jgi:endonuclease/exonuclease/phosphatase family metal-dependent hydrolase